MKKIANYSKYLYLLGALFVGCLFFYITYKTPLCGDDWGYALNAAKAGPIESAIGFYTSWSGRFFSEVWCFFGAANKWFWNLLNPILFMISFIGIYKLSHVKNKHILIPILIIAIILSVDDNLRMETYTFMTGTIYTIPLALSFIYFMIMDKLFYDISQTKNKHLGLVVLSNIILFYIGMTTENIAATMLVAIVIELIYAYFNNKNLVKYLIINLVFSSLSFMIMRLSPGSSYRLLRDHAEWSQLNIFEKLANGYPNFIEFTFLKNDYLILFLSLTVILLLIFTKKNINKLVKYLSIGIQMLAIFTVFSFVIIKNNNFLLDSKSLYSMLFWPIYTVDILLILWLTIDGKRREKAIFFFMVAGTANIVMLYSPIFGSRSAIYTVFYMIVVISLILDNIKLSKYILLILTFMSVYIIFDRTNEYLYKYNLVGLRQNERLEVIKYYQDHPEVEEAWIPRFPIYTVHSGDVEEGDIYHFETFKEYYNLPQNADDIIFYYVED